MIEEHTRERYNNSRSSRAGNAMRNACIWWNTEFQAFLFISYSFNHLQEGCISKHKENVKTNVINARYFRNTESFIGLFHKKKCSDRSMEVKLYAL